MDISALGMLAAFLFGSVIVGTSTRLLAYLLAGGAISGYIFAVAARATSEEAVST